VVCFVVSVVFSSSNRAVLQVEAKTRKLKKVWNKLQMAQAEIRDLTEEFQKEKEDMLDTIRELNKQLKLKQILLDNFVPNHEVEKVSCAVHCFHCSREISIVRIRRLKVERHGTKKRTNGTLKGWS
jgi:hypothetical protein